MNDEQLQTLDQVKRFIKGSQSIEFKGLIAREKYHWIEEVLKRFRYPKLQKEGKGLIKLYIMKVTGYSRAQLTRLISLYLQCGKVQPAKYQRHHFPQKYSAEDVALLAKTDELHGWLSGPATKKILERENEVYGHYEYASIAAKSTISAAAHGMGASAIRTPKRLSPKSARGSNPSHMGCRARYGSILFIRGIETGIKESIISMRWMK